MARGESRGGGYDLATDKNAKKALGTQTRQSAASDRLRSNGELPQAPTSIGQLMTPSMGREGPPVDEADLQQRTQRNESFLSDPNTQMMLKQFGMSMLNGNSIGHSMYQAMTVPERAAIANAKAEEQGLDITKKRLDIAKLSQELAGGGAEKTPTELMKLLNEAAAEEQAGNKDNAAILRSRAYQLSQEFSMSTGQILNAPGMGTPGNAGDATSATPSITNIPGGKADVDAQAAISAANTAKMKDIQTGALVGSTVDQVNQILDTISMPNLTAVGVLGGNPIMNYLSQSSSNVAGLLETIRGNASFTQLQAMRAASKTGGALGQVSDFENRLLSATLASVAQTQDKEQLQQNLKTLKFLFDPASIDARANLAQALTDKKITPEEATNAWNHMYREAVFGPTVQDKPAIDMAAPPPYVSEKMKEVWGVLTPEEKSNLLNDEDRAKLK